ncbi:MAG: mandelate racemase/muconate lactonizing enzyme family protein [Deltaproteobacteria bacterium]|nr:mandelate racemase/muconate lactonizing enzyme family protein [Deltaproteobacteria bacterium]
MKITKVEATGLYYRLRKPYYTSQRATDSRSCILVFVHTDEGIVGIGESDCAGGPLESTVTVIEQEIAPVVTGKDPFAVEAIWREMYQSRIQHGRRGILMHAMSGIDIALWDIIGKAAKLPLYKILGANSSRLRTYASGGYYMGDLDDRLGMTGLLENLESSLEKGFVDYKMKIGRLSVEADMNRVREVRKRLPDDGELMVDSNFVYDLPAALKCIPYLEELEVKFWEEPLHVDNPEDAAYLATKTRIPLAGSENETSMFGFRDIMSKNAAYYLQPNVSRTGGITALKKIAGMAEAWNRVIAPHCYSTMINIVATMHVLASIPNGLFLEWDANETPFREDLIAQSFTIDGGYVNLQDGPGLGIELNMDTVNKYRKC